ncbi:hypothetical protein C8Q78DRAFT_471677 [Trametes maxima]|nr:hypothetical protein C8Q78DRAFT_471677 [Trametes maxima]
MQSASGSPWWKRWRRWWWRWTAQAACCVGVGEGAAGSGGRAGSREGGYIGVWPWRWQRSGGADIRSRPGQAPRGVTPGEGSLEIDSDLPVRDLRVPCCPRTRARASERALALAPFCVRVRVRVRVCAHAHAQREPLPWLPVLISLSISILLPGQATRRPSRRPPLRRRPRGVASRSRSSVGLLPSAHRTHIRQRVLNRAPPSRPAARANAIVRGKVEGKAVCRI